MGRPQSVSDCRTAQDFERVISRQGGRIVRGARHDIVQGRNGGRVAIPRHRGDLPTGTRCAIIRELLMLGFMVVLLTCCVAVCIAPVAQIP